MAVLVSLPLKPSTPFSGTHGNSMPKVRESNNRCIARRQIVLAFTYWTRNPHRSETSIGKTFQAAVDHFRLQLEVLVNNAAVCTLPPKDLNSTEMSDYDNTFSVSEISESARCHHFCTAMCCRRY